MRCGKSLSLTDVYIERLQSLFHMRNRIVYYVRKKTTINVNNSNKIWVWVWVLTLNYPGYHISMLSPVSSEQKMFRYMQLQSTHHRW